MDSKLKFEIERENRRMEYENYLKSKEWKRKSRHIKRKHNGKCMLCFAPAKVVHHLTYDRVYLEDERDLIPLCNNCHNFIHRLINDYKIL